MNGKLFFTVMIMSLSFNVFSSDNEYVKNAQSDYVIAIESLMNNQINFTYNNQKAGANLADICISNAPNQFLEQYKLTWQSALHTEINNSMFLNKDLQLFKRIAIFSCVESAFHTKNGYGNEFLTVIKNQVALQRTKTINDAYQQTKLFKLEASLRVSEYGFSLIK